jgi:hypothetical protein
VALQPLRGSLLLGSALAGIGLSVWSIAGAAQPRLGPDVVALVNGVPIVRADYETARRLRRKEMDRELNAAEQRKRALAQVVDEELLVQRALELDLVRKDDTLRYQLRTAVEDAVVADALSTAGPVDEQQLEAHYREHAGEFLRSPRAMVERLFFRVAASDDARRARGRAEAVAARLAAGETFETVRTAGDPPPQALPLALLPASALRIYLGAAAADRVFEMQEGQVSAPIGSPQGFQVLRVAKLEPRQLPPLAEVRALVEASYRKTFRAREVERYLEQLRRRAVIVTAGPGP